MKTGTELIAEERERQISSEGWASQHDDRHIHGELAAAAYSYVDAYLSSSYEGPRPAITGPPSVWPWEANWWKPSTPLRDLVKAGALIAAEIDRIQRATTQPATHSTR